jgi:8-oxo-dGTP pyrophosphatase MutT (NUDIX family)
MSSNKFKKNYVSNSDGLVCTKAGIILINNQDKILLVKNRNKNVWGFPKGSIERGESVLDCAYREFNEETGMILDDTECFCGVFINDGCHYFIFRIAVESLEVVNEIDTKEVSDVQWVFEKYIKKLNMSRSLKKYYDNNISVKYKKKNKKQNVDVDGWTVVT